MSIPRFKTRRLVVAILAIILALVPSMLSVSSASAAPSVHRGAGILVGGNDFVGQEDTDGYVGYCIDPPKRLDYGQTWKQISNLTGVHIVQSRELEYVLYHYGHTTSNSVAASVRIALNEIVGNKSDVTRWKKALGKTVSNRADGYVHAASLYYGPYNTVVKVTRTALVGQAASASISLTSATHHGVPGVTMDLSAANATVAKSVRTNSKGAASVSFVHTGTGTGMVKLTAKAVGLAPTTMLLSNAHSGQQRLLSWTSGTTASGSASFQKSSSGTVTYSCNTICNGHPPVTYSWCHAAYEATRQYHVVDNGRVVKTVEVKRSSHSSCVSATVVSTDTHKVTATCSYYSDATHKWGAAVSCGPTVVVDCPPWPVVNQTLSCNCTSGSIVLSLKKNTTTHVEAIYYSVDGAAQVQKTVQPGSTLSVTIPFNRTTADTDVVFTGAVQRTSGSWNVGSDEEVIVRKVA